MTKVSLNGIDLSTNVKPIAVTEEEALEKAKIDNETQAQFKDDTVDGVIQTRTTIYDDTTENKKVAKNTVEEVKKAMVNANKKMDVEAFNKANEVMSNGKEKMNKELLIVLGVSAAVIIVILLIEFLSIIGVFE